MYLNTSRALFCIYFTAFMVLASACGQKDAHQVALKSGYTALDTMAEVYDITMTIAGDAYKDGLLTDQHKEKLIGMAKLYRSVGKKATNAFKLYQHSHDAGILADATANFRDLKVIYNDMVELLKEFGVNVSRIPQLSINDILSEIVNPE